MPIHVDIKINDTMISQIHIARFLGGTYPNDINTYLVVRGERPTDYTDWVDGGKEFTHRYGDGAEVCVAKAIEALVVNDGAN